MYYPTRQIVLSVFVCCFIFTWFSFRNQCFGMFRDPDFALFPSGVVSWISCIPVFLNPSARALIGQSAMLYCASKPMEISRVF